jgi:thioredoxin-like negative regulator of GroEL
MGDWSRLRGTFPSLVLAALLMAAPAFAADDLKLNPHLDYSSDSVDGPLITGSNIQAGVEAGKPNYVIIYAEGCYNSKRQARRTVDLYEKYRGKVNFVIVDLDKPRSPAQQKLIEMYYQGSIPDLIVLDAQGKPLYNQAGEQDERVLSQIFDKALN